MQRIIKRFKQDIMKKTLPERKVDFLIAGTQAGGTTALNAYLRCHPKLCMAAKKKEVNFFCNNAHFTKGKPDYSKYHSYFHPNKSHALIGEATPVYMYWHDAAKRIWDYNPKMKLIFLLRNPIDRAYSHWNKTRYRHKDDVSFSYAIENERERCREALPRQHKVYSYIDRGFYLQQLRRFWQYFPMEQTLVLKNEYLKEQPTNALHDICYFLGVESCEDMKVNRTYTRPYLSKMSDKERHYLKTIFEYEIKGLERTLNWDCSDWLN
jgi:Sulfotransferase domain